MSKEDGRWFGWIKNTSLWIEPRPFPQLIVDAEIGKYLVNHQNPSAKLEVIGDKHVLTLDEYNLNIDELVKKYPLPQGSIIDVS